MSHFRIAALLTPVLALACGLGARAADAPAKDAGGALTTQSSWRCFFVWGDEVVKWDSGETTPVNVVKGKASKAEGKASFTAQPPEKWSAADFDDSSWTVSPGPIVHAPYRRDLAGLYLRGRFEVPDPAAAGELTLDLGFRGGAVVYLNGKEVARQNLPAGALAADAVADDYGKDAYVGADGQLLKGAAARVRKLECKLPAAGLQKGVNVLAIELRRAPTAEIMYSAPSPKLGRGESCEWSMLGFQSLALKAAAVSDVGPARKLALWAGNPLVDAWDRDAADLGAGPAVIRLAGARNGAFTGVLMLRSAEAVKSIEVKSGELKCEAGGSLPASAVQVRYALAGMSAPDGAEKRHAAGARYLGILDETAPKDVAVPEGSAGVNLPVWLTVRVPADAKPGDYRGAVTVAVNGGAPVEASVEISVAGYALPDTKEFVSFANIMESPESVALRYGVEPWSEEHWKLLDRTFALLGEVGVKELFVPLICQSNLGNEFSMVRRIKKDGGWDLDFAVAEKYLDLAVKHLGKVPVVILYSWTPTMGGGGFGSIVAKTKNDRPLFFTVLDPASGKMTTEQGPDWGSTESVPFWKPVFEGMLKRLAERGLEKSAALGMLSDRVPSKQAVEDLSAAAPGLGWVMHAHGRGDRFADKPLMLDASVWGVKGPFLSSQSKKPGWQNRVISTVFPRYGAGSMGHVHTESPVGVYHAVVECYQASGYNGLDRVGADFWAVVKNGKGQPATVLERYPSWQRPGAPTMTNGVLLYPAAGGPVATVRFEALRLGVQECEARIFVEKALCDKDARAKLGDDLAKRAQELLDERVSAIIRAKEDRSVMYSVATDASWLGYAQSVPDRARRLFAVAAEVAAKLK